MLSTPHIGTMAKLEAVICSNITTPTTAQTTSDWLFKCSRLDRATSPNHTSLMDPKGAGALVGVLRSSRTRNTEDNSKMLRRDWGTDSYDTASSSSASVITASSTAPETCHSKNDPYRPIEKALKNYRVAFQQRASRRENRQANEEPWYDHQTTDVYPSGSSPASSEYGALPLGVNTAKKVTWFDWVCVDEPAHIVTKKVTWSKCVQVYRIENVLDMRA